MDTTLTRRMALAAAAAAVATPASARDFRPIAASLDTADLAPCTDASGEIRLPQADARYDVVYSLRTLAHLGHDEASSDLGVRSLLAEAARVTVPGGVILVDINNPRSLRGFYYGIRHPITVVATGSVVLADAQDPATTLWPACCASPRPPSR